MTDVQRFHLDRIPSIWSELLSPGRRITARSPGPGDYYHTRVSLEFEDGGILKAITAEHCLAHFFDCFTLTLEKTTEAPKTTIPLSPVFEIGEAFALIRDEWLCPVGAIDGKTVGDNPCVHASGLPGSAPEGANLLATCLAGVLLVAPDGRRMAILAAADVPLNVDVVSDADAVDELVRQHECRLLDASAGTAQFSG